MVDISIVIVRYVTLTLMQQPSSMADLFREKFKYYKARNPLPDLSLPLDISDSDTPTEIADRYHIKSEFDNQEWSEYGLIPPSQWRVFLINKNSGLLLIKNPFSSIGQRYWIARCLKDFPVKPHKTNLDAHFNDITDWWKKCNDTSTENVEKIKKSLRWVTLGYHHDWDSKLYSEDNKHDFPFDIGTMCRMIASCFGFEDYLPQASIINYYHMDSTLAPHTDHSEKYLDAPLFSLSFGQSAIFLIGGQTKCIEPTAIYLHSGDILIMSKESRLCYHAVPRIVFAKKKPWVLNPEDNNKYCKIQSKIKIENLSNEVYWKPFSDYIEKSRINMNVRQVLHLGQKDLNY